MIPALTVILLLTFSFLITKIATIALVQTGLSKESAKFQSRSAFTRVGYATKESENVVNHPVRRKIIMLLMVLGNAGIVSVTASVLITVLGDSSPSDFSLAIRIGLLIGGIIVISILFSSKIVNRWLSKIINYALRKYTKLEVKDYSALLHLAGEYEVHELYVEKHAWLAQKCLRDLALPKEGLFILGINRKGGNYIGIPTGDTKIMEGDSLIIYGKASSISRLSARKKDGMTSWGKWLSERKN